MSSKKLVRVPFPPMILERGERRAFLQQLPFIFKVNELVLLTHANAEARVTGIIGNDRISLVRAPTKRKSEVISLSTTECEHQIFIGNWPVYEAENTIGFLAESAELDRRIQLWGYLEGWTVDE